MDYIATPEEAAELLRMHPGSVRRRLRAGGYAHAVKDGRRWLLNVTKEFPELGIERDPAAVAPAAGPCADRHRRRQA